MVLVEHNDIAPATYHYTFQRGSSDGVELSGATESLRRQGCTRVIHVEHISYGIVEPLHVVQQRAREPQYG